MRVIGSEQDNTAERTQSASKIAQLNFAAAVDAAHAKVAAAERTVQVEAQKRGGVEPSAAAAQVCGMQHRRDGRSHH